MIITIRINKGDTDLENALLAIPDKERAQSFKNAYRNSLKEKEANDIKTLLYEIDDISKKILNYLTNNDIPVIVEKVETVDTTEVLTTEEETLAANRKILTESMRNFGEAFNFRNGGKKCYL